MSKTLSIGDTANLRSGGPTMTVVGFEKHDSTMVNSPDLSPRGFGGLVRCMWFDESAKLQTHAFPHGLLDMKSGAPKDEPMHATAEKRLDASADVERRNAEVRRIQAQNAAGQAQRHADTGEQGQPRGLAAQSYTGQAQNQAQSQSQRGNENLNPDRAS